LIGTERSNPGPENQSLVVGLHVIFGRVDAGRIAVVRVIDGRENMDEDFKR
jgi:plasmid stabilization system protein ParE